MKKGSVIRQDKLKGSGNGFKLSGNYIEWEGDSNMVVGNDAIVRGDKNIIVGKRAKVYGNKNKGTGDDAIIEGDKNEWKGEHCGFQGNENTINGQPVANGIDEDDLAMYAIFEEERIREAKKQVAPENRSKVVECPTDDECAFDKESSGKPCVICLTNESICVATPCMHQSYCVKCAIDMTFGPKLIGEVLCAVCRVPVHMIKRVF